MRTRGREGDREGDGEEKGRVELARSWGATAGREQGEESEGLVSTKLAGKENEGGGSFSFVSRRNKGISDDKCQACTRSTGSASKELSRRGVGIKEDVGRLGVHPLSYKELPVKNNTTLYTPATAALTAPIPRITAFCAAAARSGAAASLRIAARI